MTTSRVRKGVLAVGIIALLFFYFPPQVLRYYLVLASHYISTPVDVEALMSAARESLTPVSSLASVAPAWKAVFNLVLGMVFIGLPILYFLQRREREEEIQYLDKGWAARLHARSEELMAVNHALVSEVSKRIDTEQSLEANRRDLRQLASQLLRLQEEERRRISRDLHDDINQRLALLSIDIERLERQLSHAAVGTVRTVRAIQDRIVELSESVRRLAHQFHPSILDDLGLPIALRRLIDDFQTRTGLDARFISKDIPQQLAQDVVTCLYRVTQEGLANVARHARAKTVRVELMRVRDGLQLMIQDDGVGFDVNHDGDRRGSLGLLSMKERVSLVAGSFTIDSTPGQGTQIRAWVPLKQECV
ncbi:MAG: sensor histidine kinase [Nitrospira sp.]|nr:sensor histidine kinase [Nitrospira sp.]MBK9949683.1 sensor histidine kinase [Nitrospira sp.]MBL8052720.1 sensor histidine kinase [Nitrospira sp.]